MEDNYSFIVRDSRQIAEMLQQLIAEMQYWRLQNADAAVLLGVNISKWRRIKAGVFPKKLSTDEVMRISAIINMGDLARKIGSVGWVYDQYISQSPKRTPLDIIASEGLMGLSSLHSRMLEIARIKDEID